MYIYIHTYTVTERTKTVLVSLSEGAQEVGERKIVLENKNIEATHLYMNIV
jgi:hypothetical protein